MLQAEVEMAASWKTLAPKERQAYLKAHPGSKFRKSGTHGTEDVGFHSHLTKAGWTKSGNNTYKHKNGRTLKIKPSSETHRHVFQITHKNGDVTSHRTNRNTRAAWLMGRYGSGVGKGSEARKAARAVPVKKVPVKVAPKSFNKRIEKQTKIAKKEYPNKPHKQVLNPKEEMRQLKKTPKKVAKAPMPAPKMAPKKVVPAAKPKAAPKAAKVSNREAEW